MCRTPKIAVELTLQPIRVRHRHTTGGCSCDHRAVRRSGSVTDGRVTRDGEEVINLECIAITYV